VALLFLHCHPIIGINNGRGVLACAKLGIATVGEKGPRPIDKPRQFYCPDTRKASFTTYTHHLFVLAASCGWVRTSLSGCPSVQAATFSSFSFSFPSTPLTRDWLLVHARFFTSEQNTAVL
jgi:hypothetical protein